MPRITPSHRLAHRAILKVSTIFNEAGALVERIANDYGEDLLVQTQLSGIADGFRIFVQVKGTAGSADTRSKPGLQLRTEHLRRWVGQIDEVLLCLYDNKNDIVYAMVPAERFSIWDLSTSNKRTMRIKFGCEDILSSVSAKQIIWSARFHYYSSLLSIERDNHDWSQALGGRGSKAIPSKDTYAIVLSFLTAVEILAGDSFDEKFISVLWSQAKSLSREKVLPNDAPFTLQAAFMMAIIIRVSALCKRGVPPNILEVSSEIAAHLFRVYYGYRWTALQKLFSVKWMPFGIEKIDRDVLLGTNHE